MGGKTRSDSGSKVHIFYLTYMYRVTHNGAPNKKLRWTNGIPKKDFKKEIKKAVHQDSIPLTSKK